MSHIQCPLCARWCPARSFPAGSGTDILVGGFRGLGRGKGFRLVGRASGLNDEELSRAVAEKVLIILHTLAARGIVAQDEVLKALGMADVARGLGEAGLAAEQWKKKAAQLGRDNNYYEQENDRMERQVKAEQDARLRAQAQLMDLRSTLSEAKSDRDQAFAAISKALPKLRAVERDVEHGAMLEEALSDTYEELERAIAILEDVSTDEDREGAWDGAD